MALKGFAQRLLRLHADDPNNLFYGVSLLGSSYYQGDLDRLDAAYRQLADAGYLEDSGEFLSFFGQPKTLYRVTPSGVEAAAVETAA